MGRPLCGQSKEAPSKEGASCDDERRVLASSSSWGT
jgi:hypothetical protein